MHWGDAMHSPRQPFGNEIVPELLENLSRRRPVFHSEADFQHVLAWAIHSFNSEWEVRLERPFPGRTKGAIDITVAEAVSGRSWAIELKYRTRKQLFDYGDEHFSLKDQSATDQGRYGFCKDITRIEEFCHRKRTSGSAIFLTNYSFYWKKGPIR